MKKVLLSVICACVALFAVSCDNDEVAKKYEVTISVSADGEDLASLSDVKVTLSKDNGEAITITGDSVGNVYTGSVIAGTYKISASATSENFNFFGEKTIAVVDKDVKEEIVLKASPKKASGIIFKEVYYHGVYSFFFQDAFYELVNNSDEVQYLDGLAISTVDRGFDDASYSWQLDSMGTLPNFYPTSGYVMMFPGSGKDYPVEPGQTVVIANQAQNHSARELTDKDTESPADLSTADWELFIPTSSKGIDNESVPNLTHIYGRGGFYFMPAVAGCPLMLFRFPEGVSAEDYINDTLNVATAPGGYTPSLIVKPEMIVDAIDYQRHGEKKIVKVFNPAEDAGYTFAAGDPEDGSDEAVSFENWLNPSYSGKSIRRKCTLVTSEGRAYFKDTNNSTEDFILGGQRAVVRREFKVAD